MAADGIGRNPSQWNWARALYAGVSCDVADNFKVELAYRNLNYGSIIDMIDCVGGSAIRIRINFLISIQTTSCWVRAGIVVKFALRLSLAAAQPGLARQHDFKTARR